MNKRPLILISNDDGIDAPGIKELTRRMSNIGNVVVAAPDRQNSAVSNALSVAKPIRVRRYVDNDTIVFVTDGTPTDTVKIAIHELMDRKPDLVVAGINHGANTSVNVMYSGTVAAATEGMLAGIPSIAFSLASHSYDANLEAAGKYAEIIAGKILQTNVPNGTMFNVNIPNIKYDEIKGIKVTNLSNSKWNDKYEKRTDPFQREYYWFAGEYELNNDKADNDDTSLLEGFVSLSPIKFDFSDTNFFDYLKNNAIFD